MYNAAIVGVGNIACYLDTPNSENILTHAHAYKEHKDTALRCACDVDNDKLEHLENSYGWIKRYNSLELMLKNNYFDILSICSPTKFHFENLKIALQNRDLKIIICEKPFVETLDQIDEIEPLLISSNKRVIINFIRSFNPSFLELKKEVSSFGDAVNFNFTFTKGLFHNGSHALDMVEFLLGEILEIKVIEAKKVEDDLFGTFFIKTTSTSGVIQNFSGDEFALFEMSVIYKNHRVKIKDSGHNIEIETTQDSKHYKGYKNLVFEKSLADFMGKNLYYSLDYALNGDDIDTTLKRHLSLSRKLIDIKDRLFDEKRLEF